MPYSVKTDVFEGPIDLLLQLITRQSVDIYEVSLAQITDEYLAAIAALPELDLETTTGFLVVAATLLELKSSRLLPRPGDDVVDERLLEERDRLLAKLVEISTFRNAGGWIAGALEAGAGFLPRVVGLEERFAAVAPDPLENLEPRHLAQAAARALTPRPEPQLQMDHVAPIRASVRDAIDEVAARLGRGGAATFAELCGRDMPRIEVVVRFLALLELFKAGAVDLVQADRFGEIRARWTGEVEVADVVAEADEYAIEGEERHA